MARPPRPRPVAERVVPLDRRLEVRDRLLPPPQLGREHPERTLDRADVGIVHIAGDPSGEWQQQLVELLRAPVVSEEPANLREQPEREEPLVVAREPRESVDREGVE